MTKIADEIRERLSAANKPKVRVRSRKERAIARVMAKKKMFHRTRKR